MPPNFGIFASRGLPALLISAYRATGRGCFFFALDGLAVPAMVKGAGLFVLGATGPE